MADRDNPRRSGKHHPKDVPKMTEAQKEALCNVTDLYHDQRSLVQIWRDAGVHYDDHVMPPPSAPRAHNQHRRQTTGSSMSQALVPIGTPSPFRNHPVSSFTNGTYASGNAANGDNVNGSRPNANYMNGNNMNGGYTNRSYANGSYANGSGSNGNYANGSHFANGAYSRPPSAFGVQQQQQTPVRPASRMGDPATAFFSPSQVSANATTQAANGNFQYLNGTRFNNGFHSRAPPTFGAQQQQQQQQAAARPASRMGDPATAFFVPGQATANTATTTATQAANGGTRSGKYLFTNRSDAEIEVMLRRLMPPGQPNAVEDDLARFYNTQRKDGGDDGQDDDVGVTGHRRMNTH